MAIWNPIIRDTAATFTTEEKSAEGLARILAGRQAFLVATEADRVIGFALLFKFRNGPGYARTLEHSVHVAAHARRAGTGRALMAGLDHCAREAGVEQLIAGISGENSGAVRFHRTIGFRKVGLLAGAGWKFGRRMDLILMQKSLTQPDNPGGVR